MPAALFFCAAVAAGFIGALDGIGGGLLLTPILTAFGADIREAIAIGALSGVVISSAASPSFLRHHLPNLKAGAFLELCTITGALIGAVFTRVVNRHFLLLFCGSTVLISGLALWKTWRHKEKLPALGEGILLRGTMLVGSYYDSAEGKTILYEGRRSFFGGFCMFAVGFIAGLLGGGGGVFIVLVCDLVMGFPTKVSIAMSTLMIGVIALASLSIYLEMGLINVRWMIPAIFGIFLGAFWGAKMLRQLKGWMVRGVFLCVLTVLGVRMICGGMGWVR